MKRPSARRSVFAIPALAALLAACGSTDTVDDKDLDAEAISGPNNKVYGKYSAEFSEEKKRLELNAELRVGGPTGTTIRLTEGAKLQVASQDMRVQGGRAGIYGTFYELGIGTSSPSDSYEFVWSRADGSAARNVLTLAKPIGLSQPTAGSRISRSEPVLLRFSGAPLDTDETARVTLSGIDLNKPETNYVTMVDVPRNMELTVPASEWARFARGPVNVSLERVRRQKPQQGHDGVGGELTSRFQATTLVLEVD